MAQFSFLELNISADNIYRWYYVYLYNALSLFVGDARNTSQKTK
jgi:hypothetical protein